MAFTQTQPRPAPRLRVSVTGLTLAGMLAILLIGAAFVPASDLPAGMEWRGNSGSLPALR
ncbi:hypothetical protein [Pseudooceanicola algae]|uniref:Uncharacterized protein n=1 Tax=Pseudooceanicola algae TaxID=1537215 RepID=A0A418SE79_9RHOB|nr:hypothetical protein [Pseudooceanicola algae]QPM89665.1 hypothetical protein PSAL_008900 [Pseudooceanicola algae]